MKASVAQAKFSALEKEKEVLEEQLSRKRSDLATQSAAAANYKRSLDGKKKKEKGQERRERR